MASDPLQGRVEERDEGRHTWDQSMDALGSEPLFGCTEMTKNETDIETTLSKLAVEHDLH